MLKIHAGGRDAYYRRLGDLRYFLWLEQAHPENKVCNWHDNANAANWETLSSGFNNAVHDAVTNSSVLTLSDPYSYERIYSCIRQFGRAREENHRRGNVKTGLLLQSLVRDESVVSFSKVRDAGCLFYDGFCADVQCDQLRPAEISLCIAAQDFVHLLVRAPQQLVRCSRRFNTIALRF